MELWKWLAIAVAAVAVLLLVGLPKISGDGPEQPQGEVLEQGSYSILVQNARVGEEKFKYVEAENGYQLSSDVELQWQGTAYSFSQTTLLNASNEVQTYDLSVETPDGVQEARIRFDGETAVATYTANGQEQTLETQGTPPWVLADNNIASHLYLLYLMLRERDETGAPPLAATLIVPQPNLTFPTSLKSVEPAMMQLPDEEIAVTRYLIEMGDTELALYGAGDILYVIEYVAQQTTAYRSDLLPGQPLLVLAQAPEPPVEGVVETELTFMSGSLKLAGTLAMPEEVRQPVAAVLMIHGSGPTDRNENAPGIPINFFNAVAYRLAQNGIASFRYDKRGVESSQGDFYEANMSDLIKDARAALEFLQAQPGVDPNQVYLLGHSEGGVLAPILATDRQSGLAGLILIAGAYHPYDYILLEQARMIYSANGLSELQVEAQVERTQQFIDFVQSTAAGSTWNDYTFEDVVEYVPLLSIQDYDAQKEGMSLAWYQDHFNYDPAATIRKVTVPVLILHGDKDLQVPSGEATLLAEALAQSGNSAVETHIIPDLNHLMRREPEDADPQLRHLDEPVDDRVLELITRWLSER